MERNLFKKTEINGLTLENRFVRSATWTGLAEADGACSTRLIDRMAELTQGGVGLIITGHAYVLKNGQAGPWQIGIYSDAQVPGYRELTDRVHELGGSIVMQLAHAGIYADPELTGQIPFAVSGGTNFVPYPTLEMNGDDIESVVEAFELAAERAQAAGFDGVQLHAAHGYLLNQFISPAYNRRSDGFGGKIENRASVLADIVKRIRNRLGPGYPVLVKLNSRDFFVGGLELLDSMRAAELLEEAGVDAIEISGGTRESEKMKSSRPGIMAIKDEAYHESQAIEFRGHLTVPLILVGGIRSYEVAKRLLRGNVADYISMCRPLIREPGLIKRWQSGDLRKAACISDNRCLDPGLQGGGISCHLCKDKR